MATTLSLPVFASALLLAGCAGSQGPAPKAPEPTAEPAGEVAHDFTVSEALPPRVYRNQSGIELRMVYLEERSDEDQALALVQFTGASFPTAGKVMLARNHSSSSDYQDWRIVYDGEERHLVGIRLETNGSREGELAVRLRMPRSNATSRLALDLEASRAFSADAFIAKHVRHKREGQLESLGQIDREFHIAKHQKWVNYRIKQLAQTCKSEIPVEVQYGSIKNSLIDHENLCTYALEGITKACGRAPSRREHIAQTVKQIQCRYGEETTSELTSDGVYSFVINGEESTNSNEMYAAVVKDLNFGRVVLEDANKRILVFDPDDQGYGQTYLGTPKKLHELRVLQHRSTWDPHATHGTNNLMRGDSSWKVKCRDRTIEFKGVSAKRRTEILENAKFEGPIWKRREFALARDNRGTYYYVDRLAPKYGGKSFRVFRGQRGQLEETKLVDIVDDSDGMIFATKRGKLRLVIGSETTQEALWIEGKERYKLVVLPLHSNTNLIYTGLGVYDSDQLGTICE